MITLPEVNVTQETKNSLNYGSRTMFLNIETKEQDVEVDHRSQELNTTAEFEPQHGNDTDMKHTNKYIEDNKIKHKTPL